MSPTRETASRHVSRKPVWLLSLILLYQFSGCAVQTRTEDDDTTNTFVRIIDLRGADGDDVFSDVCILNAANTCSVENDNAEVEIAAQVKDLAQLESDVNDVVFNRYRVTYIRADGRNVPGVDVPYPFDGAATFRVASDGTATTRAFMVVRHQAKLESPLAEMAQFGGAQVLSVIARIDFFGVDVAGRNIQVTGQLNITFGDFPDN